MWGNKRRSRMGEARVKKINKNKVKKLRKEGA